MSSGQRRKGAGCEGVACEHTLGEQPLHLYGYLWVKPPPATAPRGNGELVDKADGSSSDDDDDDCGRFSAVVTDTVVFKHQKPVKWLFTSKQEKGKLLCKSRKSLSIGQVLQEFLTPKLYTRGTRNDESELILATFAYTERSAATGELQLIAEHLDKAGLTNVLLHRDKPAMSVLQRFVPTKSGYNHMLQSVFTPESCVVRKCVNANLVSDAKMSVTQRSVTFEADENDLRARDVTNKELQQSIEQIHVEFSAHLEKIVGKEIVRHVAYFKIGADERVYLLWSTLISFERPGKTFAKSHRLALACAERHRQSAAQQQISHANKQLGLYAQLKCCPVCNLVLPRSQLDFLVTYKAIISHAESELSAVRGRDGQPPPVPALLLKICGPMKKKRFEQLKSDSTFLYQTIHLCQPCSQKLTPRVQPEAPSQPHAASSKKSDETRTVDTSAIAPQLPPASQPSAHALFWGKVAREEKLKSGMAASKARPFSADIPRARFLQRNSSKSTHSSRQHHRLMCSQLPPVVHTSTAPESLNSHQDRIEDIVQHLQRKYHRPSLRFALAQCNIFPPDSLVPASVLDWVCAPELVAAISRHWAELCKSRGDTAEPTTIDIDSFDGILMNRVETAQQQGAVHVGDIGRVGKDESATSAARASIPSEHAPTRPSRPKSSSARIPASRTNSFTSRFMSGSGRPRQVQAAHRVSEEQTQSGCQAAGVSDAPRMPLSVIDAAESSAAEATDRLKDSSSTPHASFSHIPTTDERRWGQASHHEAETTVQASETRSNESAPHVLRDAMIRTGEAAKQQEQSEVQPATFEQPIAHGEAACTAELSEEELRVLEETLMKYY